MGVIAQFYLVAPVLCKALRKNGYLTLALSISVTVVAKIAIYCVLYQQMETPGWYAFYAGRQLLTALDNFVVGMFAAWFVQKYPSILNHWRAWLLAIAGFVVQLFVCSFGLSHGIHTNNFSGYSWHTLVAFTIGLIMIGLSYAPEMSHGADAILQFLAKHEYVIFLWHLPVYDNLIQRSELIMRHTTSFSGIILLVMAATLAGVILSNASIKVNVLSCKTSKSSVEKNK